MAKHARKSRSISTHSARPKFSKRYPRIEDMPVVHRHAAGIDLGGDVSHFVALEVGDELEVREFGAMTSDLHALVQYLGDNGVTTVAMEATGVYWMPLYDLLEAGGFEVYLVNPSHVKNVPGREKNDKLDARWIYKLHKFGLLSASFRPGEEIRPLRSYHRLRTKLVKLASDEVRRMQKALDRMNVRIHKAISDICGMTGQRIIRSIINGERNPMVLAAMRDPRCKCTEAELIEALTGYYQPHLVFDLKQAVGRCDFLVSQIEELDKEIELHLAQLIPLPDQDIAEKAATVQHDLQKGKHAPKFDVVAYVTLFTSHDPTCLPELARRSHLACFRNWDVI